MSASTQRSIIRSAVLLAAGALLAWGAIWLSGSASASTSPAGTSPLRAYLAAKADAIEAASAQPGRPIAINAKVTAESRSGVRRLRIGNFQALSDSDRSYAGYNLGAGSWDSLVGTLASAVADEYLVQAAAAGIALDSLDVVFTSRPEDPAVAKTRAVRYPRNLGYVAYIDSPATDGQLEELQRAVEQASSALHLVTEAQPLDHAQVELVASPRVRDPSLPPGLRDFLAQEKRPAILRRQAQAARGTGQQDSGILQAHARVEPHTGLRHVSIGADGYHQQLHDSTPELLGYSLAPTVEEHLLGVTGTCLTHIFEVQAATRQVVLDALELTVEATVSPRFGQGVTAPPRYQDIRYSVRIESPAPAAQIDDLRDAVEASCPLYNLLKDAQSVHGAIVRGRYRTEVIP